MTRDELIALARRICTADGTEEEVDGFMDELENALPYSDVITLIFKTNQEFTPEEAIDEAFRREVAWKRDKLMTREELIVIASPLDNADQSEEERDAIVDRLVQALPHGNIIQFLFHTREELAIEEAIDEALRHEAAWRAENI